MTRQVSVLVMAAQICGLLGTKDLSDWETTFCTSIKAALETEQTTELSDKQVEKIEQIWKKHFA